MGRNSDVFAPMEMVEDLIGTVELSLLLHLPGCDSATRLRRELTGLRIAGGLIQNEDVEVSGATPDGSAFRSLRRGHAMIRPERPERRLVTTGGPDGLAAIAATLFPAERGPGFGTIVPSAVGYRLLEDPARVPPRVGTRSREIPHVFAEPVLGIAELVSVRNPRLTRLTMSGLDALFWCWEAKGDLVLGHRAYHAQSITSDRPKEVMIHD